MVVINPKRPRTASTAGGMAPSRDLDAQRKLPQRKAEAKGRNVQSVGAATERDTAMPMSTFMIQDENTRDLLEYALWSRASMEADNLRAELEQAVYDWLRGDPTAMRRGDTALTLVQTIRADIERVRAACLGEIVEVPIPDLADELANCAHFIEEGFWDHPSKCEEMLALREAAVQLLAIVGPVEAVA